ncbi:MAG: class I SAM-dependent methyltransferase [Glaciimonas sp.]|nr:class I SAM-dependent methyltransferase [Glaciimonas sp.]
MTTENILESEGYCSTCNQMVSFVAKNAWLRDHFFCTKCGSIPRERALMHVIEQFYPNWRDLIIHETSPGNRGASVRLAQECKNYIPSQFFLGQKLGAIYSGMRCENLEALSFDDESIDLHISQDVMEHIFHPDKAFKEVARTLKPGGAHIFTVPLMNKTKKSERWASQNKAGKIIYHHEPEYHGNPIDATGALVTMHWGFDLAGFITEVAKTPTTIISIDNLNLGIRAEYIEVLMSVKCDGLSELTNE